MITYDDIFMVCKAFHNTEGYATQVMRKIEQGQQVDPEFKKQIKSCLDEVKHNLGHLTMFLTTLEHEATKEKWIVTDTEPVKPRYNTKGSIRLARIKKKEKRKP